MSFFDNFFINTYKEFDIIIVGIFGRNNELGEGKTILLSYLADEFYKQTNKPIYADYKLPFLKGQIYHINDFVKCVDCGIFLDDIIPLCDSRHSMANIIQTWVLNTCRKNKISLFFTSQLKGAIDGRLRNISNFVIETEKRVFPRFKIWVQTKNLKKIIEFEIEYSKRIQNIYDTYEIVKRQIKLKDLKNYFEKFNNRKGFRQITKAKYGFKGDFSDTVFTLLTAEDIDSIKELLIPYGYELIHQKV